MVQKYNIKGIEWVDLESPTNDEIREIMNLYDIDPAVSHDLALPTMKPHIERHGECIYAVMHFPAWKHSKGQKHQEIDFVIGKQFIITSRYESVDAIHRFSKQCEVDSILNKNTEKKPLHGGHVFYLILKELYTSLEDELDFIRDSLRDIEDNIFAGNEKEMVQKMSHVSREILLFNDATAHHQDILETYRRFVKSMFEDGHDLYVESIETILARVIRTTKNHYHFLSELRKTNDSLLESKQSRLMQVFTAIMLTTSVMNIIASWFLVESEGRPFYHSYNEFWYVGIIMASSALTLILVMKWKKWI
jgi:magnesium transporter